MIANINYSALQIQKQQAPAFRACMSKGAKQLACDTLEISSKKAQYATGLVISGILAELIAKLSKQAKNKPFQEAREQDAVHAEKSASTVENLKIKLANASSREDFVAIRDEIKKLPNGEEKTQFINEYTNKYKEWSTNPARPDIKIQFEGDGAEATQTKANTDFTVEVNTRLKNMEVFDKNLIETARKNNPEFTDALLSIKNEDGSYKYSVQDIEWFTDKDVNICNEFEYIYGKLSDADKQRIKQMIKENPVAEIVLKVLSDFTEDYELDIILNAAKVINSKNIKSTDKILDSMKQLEQKVQSCKSLEELQKCKEDYLKDGINISDDLYNIREAEIISTEIAHCNTEEKLEGLKNKYKALGIDIPDKIFQARAAKIRKSHFTDTEMKIKAGNFGSQIRAQRTTIDLSNPKYETNLESVCNEIQQRLETEMGVLSKTQISDIAKDIAQRLKIPETEVLTAMSKLTQFGNMKSLNIMASEMEKLGISGFYPNCGISTNSALNYFLTKGQFSLNGNSGKQAFILDDASLQYLESLSPREKAAFSRKVKSGNVVLIELDGTCFKVGEHYYSYTMLDGGQSLSAMTEAALKQVQAGKTIDEVLQGDFRQKLNQVFGDDTFADNYVQNISNKNAATAQNISTQIRPNMPDAKYIKKVIDTVVKETKGLTDTEKTMTRSVLAKYYDYMGKVYSSDSFAELLKAKHDAIAEKVAQLGKTMDDVVYIYPTTNKSFDLVNLVYAKVNGINPNDIFLYNRRRIRNGELNDKVVVLLDDISASGETMIDDFYKKFLLDQKGTNNVIFAPIICAEEGKSYINEEIYRELRTNQDFLVYDAVQTSSYSAFQSQLTPEEKRVFNLLLDNKLGYENNALATGFQYMIPDNNSCLGGYFNLMNLNNVKSDKSDAHRDNIGTKLCNYIKKKQN